MPDQLRVWWIPQVPGTPYYVPVDSITEGAKIMDVLADYDQFQYENNIKPDYANVGGIQRLDKADGSWTDWYDEETGEADPRQFLAEQGDV